jgi:putative addiction module component (TIGR02574 family)
MSTLQEIEAAVLRLPEKERLRLTDKLLGSLPPPPSATDADAILAEAIRRDAELEGGATKPMSESEFWQGVRRRG